MTIITQLSQLIVGLGLLNVWLVRFNQATDYRGGAAQNMKEEFSTYGLPGWFCYVVGGLKIVSGLILLIGLVVPGIAIYPAAVVSVLMMGALVMHVKVHDPLKKSIPAACVLALCALIIASPFLS
ncbi:MAG: DoxX family protein [Proteobacteria bacterium]|nr:DoxX family protein [Pseudomonadota bacterium]NDG25604.1 DoxX family protein [Pseudomonadota bacterium]